MKHFKYLKKIEFKRTYEKKIKIRDFEYNLDDLMVTAIRKLIVERNKRLNTNVNTLFINKQGDIIGDNNNYLFSKIQDVLGHRKVASVNKCLICIAISQGMTHTEINKRTGYREAVIMSCDRAVYNKCI